MIDLVEISINYQPSYPLLKNIIVVESIYIHILLEKPTQHCLRSLHLFTLNPICITHLHGG